MYSSQYFKQALAQDSALKLSYVAYLIERALLKPADFALTVNDHGAVEIRYAGPALPLGHFGGYSSAEALMSHLSRRLSVGHAVSSDCLTIHI